MSKYGTREMLAQSFPAVKWQSLKRIYQFNNTDINNSKHAIMFDGIDSKPSSQRWVNCKMISELISILHLANPIWGQGTTCENFKNCQKKYFNSIF